ncbi:hypothetical protein [Sporosarcina sp. FSL W7-1283]|uniref:hypothetical protein n=1 Tax=Sporosarcina sp. FSL W7-1283 TaxID=2921560 RepID=UPI0030FC2A58
MNKAERKRRTQTLVDALSWYGIKSINGYSLHAIQDHALRKRLAEERAKSHDQSTR